MQNMVSSFIAGARSSQTLMRSGRRLKQRRTASPGAIKASQPSLSTLGSTPLMVSTKPRPSVLTHMGVYGLNEN